MREKTVNPKVKLLDAALQVIRAQGYAGTSVDDICRAAGVTKGSFFHHFKGKDELAIAAVGHWTDVTGALFANAPFRSIADPRERVLAYVDFRAALIRGELPDFTCLLGTMVQETYATHPAIRDACEGAILFHARTVAADLEEAKRQYAPQAGWEPLDLALFIQAGIQGAFILAKAADDAAAATRAIAHLRNYLSSLLPG
ncbi:TetR/AcrR family transcriptional regulator [Massilia endophytica]|uniref:TetR/AcrR family transcriptional regulator n=1 Tax=Massilia endophytica TaxID=2899220 RepID=UPI001E5F2D61|nr:TetR/AcrR family transcriptional regulator [Massilia endophytica]UGQ48569.1 TetR/AcrR family transcriptional regulator [Massilia endophytica]